MPGFRELRRHLAAAVLVLAGLLTVPCDVAAAPPVVSAALVQDLGERTRLVLDVDRQVTFRVFVLANPDRVVIDLERVRWGIGRPMVQAASALVQRVRYGVFNPSTSRIVIDTDRPARVDGVWFTDPVGGGGRQLLVDLVAVRHGAAATARSASPPSAARTGWAPPPPRRKPAGPRIVVIDPGHGGIDPGARAVSGALEKHVTLAAARRLRDHLHRTGRYRVVLTRDRDVHVRLRRRFEVAREAGAEVFLSLHADAHPDGRVRGASVYTLSEQASDAEAAALAERENKADLIAGVDLSHEAPEVANILIDLARRETRNRSSRLATDLVAALKRETALLRNSHRFAGFAVLKAPDVPSVLIELGYLSNREDAGLLGRRDHMERLAVAITMALDRYFTVVETAERR